MLKEFYLKFISHEFDSQKIKHIQYNYIKRLNKLKYVSYRRIDIMIEVNDTTEEEKIEILWDDTKTSKMICNIDKNVANDVSSLSCIIQVYKKVFNCLTALWKKNKWESVDLHSIFANIESEWFKVSITYGKTYLSPNKKHKAEIFCDIFPDYADYYLKILCKGSINVSKFKFFKGLTNIDFFFSFFNNYYWRDDSFFLITDINKEIFFLFNIEMGFSGIEYKPFDNSIEKCKNFVQAFQASVTQEQRLKLLDLPPIQ